MLFNTRYALLLSLAIILGGCASALPATSSASDAIKYTPETTSNTSPDDANDSYQVSAVDDAALENINTQVENQIIQPALSLRTARFAHSSATDNKLLYVFSGYGKQGYLTDVEIIDPLTAQVTVLANKVLPRGYFSAVFDQQHSIYLIGGIGHETDDVRVEPRIEVFNTLTHEVTILGDIPEPLRNNKAVYINGYIYLVGGASYEASNGYKFIPSASLWRYDITRHIWQKLANMPSAKSTVVVATDQVIYAIGGERNLNDLASVERYDIATNQWHSMPNLPHPISAHSAVITNNNVWLFANEDQLQRAYTLTLPSDTWHGADIDYQPALYTSANAIGKTLFVIGGNGGKGNSFMNQIQVLHP
ncbi:kelch repeat-containing protein [Paraglaciecola sp. 20A4]|uniref:Kelch repeat-containing protein n=1 Tax=Paraglaciecola sp. 20A4 TaxID=2687288 RepID=UPI00140DD78E|nr:kelch repeat-containing protein [Paraglaciecola sp. 20A4]